MSVRCVFYGPEEVYVDLDEIANGAEKVENGEWVGTEKEWRDFIDRHSLTVETSDEDYAIINNKAVFVGVEYEEYNSRGHYDDEY